MPDGRSNWRDALDTRDLETLRLLITIIREWEKNTGTIITPVQLRSMLETSA